MRSLIRFPPRIKPAAFAVVVALTALSAAATAVAAPGSAGASARAGAQRTKVVRYHGYRLVVPASWPVFNLAADPTVCVRFNRHAVYLGTPGAHERCPAHAVGRTEAILVSPMAAHGARAGAGGGGQVLPPVSGRNAQPSQGSSTQRAVPSDGVMVTATWSSQPGLVARALEVPSVSASHTGTAAAVRPQARAAAVHKTGDIYTGPGFDACSTPSATTMSDWGASPYRAVGIYVGGANMACSQTNLTPAWVQQESAAGWTLLPVYVGLQAPSNSCGCAAITPSQASAEGTAAAQDAVNQAEAVGISPGNPIYDDMEAYNRTTTNTDAVLAFLSAWTTELHAEGYVSGVYSSANSGVTDLVNEYGTGYAEPDQLWIADWNNQETTSDPYVPASDWANHQRLHQYRGGHNETYDGATINIDSDYVDAGGAAGGALFPNGTFVEVSGTTQIWEIAGGAPLLVSNWSDVGGEQTYTVITQQQFDALNPVPADGTFLQTDTGAVYRVAGGAPMYISDPAAFGTITPVEIDEWDIDNVGNPASHLNPVPANGTFISTTTGSNYRIAGGAPIGITTWTVFGGMQPSVMIDPWDLANVWNPLARLDYRPAINTVVEGLPSGAYWRFGPKNRYLVPPTPGAVRVDDRGLKPFSATICRVPNLAHQTLTQVKAALIKADCLIGKVRDRPVTRRRHTLRVIKQSVAPRVHKTGGYLIGVTLG
ncbi:MAG TPA: DUF1906 domain-containing protein [Solirubrobacteraceae bacterium]|nr:DUF1906 domain-containing protein [Solirubrobacteraceae bacterium]